MRRPCVFTIAALVATVSVVAAAPPEAAAPQRVSAAQDDENRIFFESRVRPVLVQHCHKCHSAKAKKLKAGLYLDSRKGVLTGGDTGPAIVPGDPAKSILIGAVVYNDPDSAMPPKKKLPDQVIKDLTEWVKIGAPWPDGAEPEVTEKKIPQTIDWKRARAGHWAFQSIRDPEPPAVKRSDWARNDIDRFVLARIEAAGLSPSPEAERRTLIRRAYFDLTGLPPTPKQVEAFVNDASSDAFAKVVDELLASPHYGERWGRHWLDVARYSDGFGGFNDKAALPGAWHYRDWVINAFNRDMPFNEFIRNQIAGDLIDDGNNAIGTGYLAVGPTYKSDGGDPDSKAQALAETIDDRVDTVTRGLLALTVACSRCHEHKFEPIPQADYYSLAGAFHNTAVVEKPAVPAEVVKAFNDGQQRVREAQKKLNDFNSRIRKAKRKPNNEEKQRIDQLKRVLDQVRKKAPPKYPTAHVCRDTGGSNMKIAIRGNPRSLGAEAPRRFLRVLAGANPPLWTKGSGRVSLADDLVDPKNPLTARVFVNRVWMWHFGQAIVRTPNNFGNFGQEPTHPDLLDWLASRFVESGWSIKQMHRTIMLSATWRQSSSMNRRAFGVDGNNNLVWRMNPRRLEVEAIRDGMLAVSGELDTKMSAEPSKNILGDKRRTVYGIISRSGDAFSSDAFMRLFDFPGARGVAGLRTQSIVPQQYLFLMNSQFVIDRARALAARLEREVETDEQRIVRAYGLLYGRGPTLDEKRVGRDYLSADEKEKPRLTRLQRYTQALMISNEFLFVR